MQLQPKFGPDLNNKGNPGLRFLIRVWMKGNLCFRGLDSEFDDGPDVIPDHDGYNSRPEWEYTICLWIYREEVEGTLNRGRESDCGNGDVGVFNDLIESLEIILLMEIKSRIAQWSVQVYFSFFFPFLSVFKRI